MPPTKSSSSKEAAALDDSRCAPAARAGIARKDRPVRLEVGAVNNAPQRRRFNQSNQSNQ
jgi:hypothetical protein